ncbi:flagellar hook assembly protein FlgD [Photobacterium galatheae]|uniref:Basal-body rod modification protein FlgD n=1 Tax=Photobacterium galatheae TaxID=1654360 RepID=A0A066RK84_9GAMM|nr:flagellar hook capping FlgD N-terminal domain-containing protein [Photobacterium galatheae]KDM90855.1 hypothetical protein EA58_13930 [Photobacterium galatheae]MCM0149177.1 hypothetical protein [Photobacterium galatheae]
MNLTSITSTPETARTNSAQQSSRGSAASQISQEFMTLLSAQMMNQDPTNPMESHELTAQLAQVASLEQQEGTNQLMRSLVSVVGTQGNFAALNTVGKEATVMLNDFSYDGQTALTGELLLDDANQSGHFTVEIKDASGRIVSAMTVGVADGQASWQWDGKDQQGNPLPEGDYHISAFQESADGEKHAVPVTTCSVIQGINFLNGMLNMANGTEIPFGNMISVAQADSA